MTSTLYLARHAARRAFCGPGAPAFDAQWAAANPYRVWDDGLTAAGKEQAAELAKQIPAGAITKIISSPFIRCVATALEVARHHNVPIYIDQSLGETRVEEWFKAATETHEPIELSVAQLQQLFEHTFLSSAGIIPALTAWETDNGQQRGAQQAAAILADPLSYDKTLLVSHGGTLWRLAEALLHERAAGHMGYASYGIIQLTAASSTTGSDCSSSSSSSSSGDAVRDITCMQQQQQQQHASVWTAQLVKSFNSPFRLTHDWCSGNFANWSAWFGHMKERPVRVLEIGSWEGWVILSFNQIAFAPY
jgi:broad specificity phosphatase PhoE